MTKKGLTGFTTLLIALSCFSKLHAQQQLRGYIFTADSVPATGATVSLKGTRKSTLSDSTGFFELHHLKAGVYVVQVSFVGWKMQELAVELQANETAPVEIRLKADAKQLEEVVVNARKNVNERQSGVSRLPVSNFNLPQSIGFISNTLIRDQQVTRVGDIIKNVAGVSLTQNRLGVNETFTARGYSIGTNGSAGSLLKNGLLTNTAGMAEAATLESIEVLKGSSSMLYGNVSGGMVINLVTKKPKFDWGGELKMQAGSYQQYKPIIDLYGPLSKHIAFRVIGTYENDKSFRDVVQTKRCYVNPSFLFKLSDKTSLLVQGEYLKANSTPDFGIGALDSGRALPTAIPISRFINTRWAYNHVTQHSVSFDLRHQFNDDWALSAAGVSQQTDVDSYGAGLPNTVAKNGDWRRPLARAHTVENLVTTQLNLTGRIKTGPLLHQLLFGTELTRIVTKTDAFRITRNGSVLTVYDTINILNPALYQQRTDIPDAALTTVTTAPGNRFGVYVQDYIHLTDRLKVLAGVRWSWQETVPTSILTVATQTTALGGLTAYNKAFSPKLALVYQPLTNISTYASYASNFTINSGTDIYGQLLKPSIIDQYELGVKNNFFENKLSANLSIYRIINSNLAQQAEYKADGTPNTDANVKELRGQTTSDGLELDFTASPSSNLYFIAGYGYNNMRFTKTTGAKGSNIEGERLVNNPLHTGNFTAFYSFCQKSLKGLKLGLSAFYTGARFGGYNNTVGQSLSGSRLIPLNDFATFDVSAAYTIKKISLQVRLSNIFNAQSYLVHDNYSISPINPRMLSVTLAYSFHASPKK
ncbi:MAG: TonB-dependent receptor [Bacteroidota bacterium]|nr:TonB-dependent receptor [Bacteroidota bacterium]